MKIRFSILLLLFATALLYGCGGGEEDTESASVGSELSADEQAFRALFDIEEDPALLAASEDFLRDHPDSPRRSFVLSNVFDLRAAIDETGAVAWAREMLPRETSDSGKAAIYGAMFGRAVTKGDRDAGLRIANDFWELDLKDSRTLNSIGWQLVEDTGWDPVLGGRMGEKAAGLVEGTERAMCLDTAAWGYFKADDLQGAERLLEEAVGLLDEPDLEFTLHLKAVYEKLGAADKLLALIEKQLAVCVNSELRVKAEDIISRRGGDLKAFDERIWAARMAGSSVAPDFELSDMNNIGMHLTDFGGKVLVLNFFYPT